MRSAIKKGIALLLLAAALLSLSGAALSEDWALVEHGAPDSADADAFELAPVELGTAAAEDEAPAEIALPPAEDGEAAEAPVPSVAEEPTILSAPGVTPSEIAVSAQAVLDGDLRMRLLLALPEGVDPARIGVKAAFDGETTLDRALSDADFADGRCVLDDVALVTLDTLTAPISVTLSADGLHRVFSFSALHYLRSLPAYTDTLPLPENRAAWTGSIDGVDDFHARIDGSALVLYFRAPNADGLSFADSAGHSFSAPVREADGLWSVRMTGLRVREAPGDLAVTVTRGAERISLQYSPFCWAALHWDERDEPFVALCRALALALA